MTPTHGGGHGWGLPGLDPIRNSSELRVVVGRAERAVEALLDRGVSEVPSWAVAVKVDRAALGQREAQGRTRDRLEDDPGQ